jgi:hypothetical protein
MNENENILQTKEFKLLFNLLEKAEQILSIINLSDSSISKYNTLKKLTFEMLNLEFKPLEKRYIKPQVETSLPSIPNEKNDDSLYTLQFINIKKSMLIDLILNYISNLNNSEQNLNYYLNSLTDIYNLSPDIITAKALKDISSEAKNEEKNMASLFTKIDQIFVNNYEILEKIKKNYEINEIKNDNNYFVETTFNLINENYEKFKQNNFSNNINNFNSIAYKDGKLDENILKLEFIKNAFDNYFINNNNINHNNNGINFQNKENAIFNDVCESLPEIIKENDMFHKNFKDLMNYIETNIEGKII